jgi:hypothetical protein
MFSGSYAAGDVSFLLKQLTVEPIADVEQKERLIQSGRKHYSEVIGIERQPSAEYLALFDRAVEDNASLMARDLYWVALRILAARPGGITLVSLARAGTPMGVALKRLLTEVFSVEAAHYSLSIIRDRGIDEVALRHICHEREPSTIAFIDGWTGKGAIGTELAKSVAAFRAKTGLNVSSELYVLCDLAGIATGCGSTDDYLIPSAILNATVSGLVSRSILNEQIGPSDFHGCLYYDDLVKQDRSRWFVDRLIAQLHADLPELRNCAVPVINRAAARCRSETLVARLMHDFDVADRNYIKPGIGEATRSLLRRTPRVLILRDAAAPAVRHLKLLADEHGVPLRVDSSLPLNAAAIIRKLSDA